MATLVVTRTDKAFPDRMRRYTVLVDGESAGRIGWGQRLELSLSPGQHEVRLKIDWCGSPSVVLNAVAGESIALVGEPAGLWSLAAMLMRPQSYLKLWRASAPLM
jgi:hypothetical protein